MISSAFQCCATCFFNTVILIVLSMVKLCHSYRKKQLLNLLAAAIR